MVKDFLAASFWIEPDTTIMTSSNENISRVTGFDVFFDLRLNTLLHKQPRRRWFGRHRAHYDLTVMSHWHTRLQQMTQKVHEYSWSPTW